MPAAAARPPPVGKLRQRVSAPVLSESGARTLICSVESSFSTITAWAPCGCSLALRLEKTPAILRDQEAAGKVGDLLRELGPDVMPTLHMVGQVQTKKARSVARWADVVHSADRPKLVSALDRATGNALESGERRRALQVLVQVDLDEVPAEGRGGVAPGEAPRIADQIAGSEHLDLRGTMAVAPAAAAGDDDALARAFTRLQQVHESIRAQHPQADWLSAGMSGDLEHAVAAGATHLRVGSGILGSRPPQG